MTAHASSNKRLDEYRSYLWDLHLNNFSISTKEDIDPYSLVLKFKKHNDPTLNIDSVNPKR